jgi:hypothetical protein
MRPSSLGWFITGVGIAAAAAAIVGWLAMARRARWTVELNEHDAAFAVPEATTGLRSRA